MAKIRITFDGKLVLTTAQAADELGVQLVSMRSEIRRLGIQPVANLDQRTPLYAAVPLRQAMSKRPGKGANLRGHK